jgi:hypothetical protein
MILHRNPVPLTESTTSITQAPEANYHISYIRIKIQ